MRFENDACFTVYAIGLTIDGEGKTQDWKKKLTSIYAISLEKSLKQNQPDVKGEIFSSDPRLFDSDFYSLELYARNEEGHRYQLALHGIKAVAEKFAASVDDIVTEFKFVFTATTVGWLPCEASNLAE